MSAGNALEQFSEHRTDLDPPGETIFAVLCNQRSNSIWTCPDDFEFAGEMKSRLPSQAEEVLAINGIPAVVKLPSQLHNSKWEALFSIAGRDFLDLEKCLERPSDLIARKLPVSKAGEIANVLALPKLPAKSNEPAKAKHSLSENQRLLANAFHQYDQTYRRLPNSLQSDSKPSGLSWRVHLLHFIEQQALYDKFDLNKPWDSSPNLELISLMPSIYKTANVQGDHSPYRMIANERSRRVTDYQRTIMFVECNTTDIKPWTKPDDIVVDDNTSIANHTTHSSVLRRRLIPEHIECATHCLY